MKVLLDLDGVLADFTGGMCRAHNRPDPWADGQNRGCYAMDELWGMTASEFWEPATEGFWAELEPTPGAFHLVRFLEEQVGAANICILSSPSLDPGCVPGKLRWIRRHLPEYSRRFLFGPRKEFCAGTPSHLLIDDHEANVKGFREAGGTAILFPRPWNVISDMGDRGLSHVFEAVKRWRVTTARRAA